MLTACASVQKIDTVELVKPTRFTEEFTMVVKVVEFRKMEQLCSKLGTGYSSNGCSVTNLDTKTCTIYVPEVLQMDDTKGMKIWGHELMHCVYGKYHHTEDM